MSVLLPWLAAEAPRLPTPDEARTPTPRATHATGDLTPLLLAEAPRLRRLIHRLLGFHSRPHELDDLTQDVLLAAWQRRTTFRGDATLATWLTSIAIRRVHNHIRWARVRQKLQSWFHTDEPTPSPTDCPVETGDEVTAMKIAMQHLRHADREVLVLHYLEGRPTAEVAQLLGVAKNALEQRLSRARTRLRQHLEEPR